MLDQEKKIKYPSPVHSVLRKRWSKLQKSVLDLGSGALFRGAVTHCLMNLLLCLLMLPFVVWAAFFWSGWAWALQTCSDAYGSIRDDDEEGSGAGHVLELLVGIVFVCVFFVACLPLWPWVGLFWLMRSDRTEEVDQQPEQQQPRVISQGPGNYLGPPKI